MYVGYGDFEHQVGEAEFILEGTPLRNANKERYGTQWKARVVGFLEGDNIDAITAKIVALEAAYSVDYLDFGLFEDDGTPTAHYVQSGDTLSGVRVTRGPVYPSGKGAEYSTYRSYELELEWETGTEDGDSDVDTMEFSERIEFTGGGPRWVYLETRNGPPQRQQVSQATTFRATQSGQATGQFRRPIPPAPLWPAHEHREQRVITPSAPALEGNAYRNYGVSWRYVFESAAPLAGVPNISPRA